LRTRLANITLQRYVFSVSKDADELDVTAVRALAHPLRLRMLDLLRFDGPATATMLARRLGESSGSTSYHLRQLARHGFIEEAAKRGGRERWWSYRERRVSIAGNADSSRVQTLLGELLSREAYALHSYLSADVRDAAWDDAAFFQTKALILTAGELKELSTAIDATVARLKRCRFASWRSGFHSRSRNHDQAASDAGADRGIDRSPPRAVHLPGELGAG
jgi:DNA-binding transcriptional ArsR family regulator